MAACDTLISWLNDACARKNGLIPILQNHAHDARGRPARQVRIQEHVEEAGGHAERIRHGLERIGAPPSTLKGALGSVMGLVEAPVTGAFSDELGKNCLMDHASENFVIAAYEALVAAAQEVGRRTS